MKIKVVIKFLIFLMFFFILVPPAYGALLLQRVNFKAVGDIMVHDVQYRSALDQETGEYDFLPMFAPVREELAADLLVGNLETTLSGQDLGYSGYPRFNSPDSIAGALKELGFDLLFTANNHSLDQGEYGLKRTLDVLDKNGIRHTGTFNSPQARDIPGIITKNGLTFGFLNYTYGTNGLTPPAGKEYLINYLDLKIVRNEIKELRPLVDVVVVAVHFGTEYLREPTNEQRYIVTEIAKAGADIILGGHPHVLQPYEFINVENRQCFVVYSLGNFVSGQKQRYRDSGAILELIIEKSVLDQAPKIVKVNYTPVWVRRYVAFNRLKMEVVPVKNNLVLDHPLTISELSKSNQVLDDVQEVWSPIKKSQPINSVFSAWANSLFPITNPESWMAVIMEQGSK
ncbi:MAG: CapA family protein [Peptococcaceae bacterium]